MLTEFGTEGKNDTLSESTYDGPKVGKSAPAPATGMSVLGAAVGLSFFVELPFVRRYRTPLTTIESGSCPPRSNALAPKTWHAKSSNSNVVLPPIIFCEERDKK